MTEALRRGHIGVVAGRMLAKYKCRNYRRKKPATGDDSSIMQYVGDCVTPWLPLINPGVEYDLCISFLTPHYIGLDKVRARKRLAWIHTDYSTVSINVERELPVWGAYDSIVSYFGRYSIIVLGLHGLYLEFATVPLSYFTGHEFTAIENFVITLLLCWLSIPIFKKYFPSLTAQTDLLSLPGKYAQPVNARLQ